MNDDNIRCILEHACHKKARRNVCPIEARHAEGYLPGSIQNFSAPGDKFVTGNGIIFPKETVFFDTPTCIDDDQLELDNYGYVATRGYEVV